jgi:4-amino-4-deoxy-L-arabinose transferase-like glycosyltransferase
MASSWQAWLAGAYDPGLATTFDKVPGTFWLQALSARMFGYSAWSVLLPSLLASVGSLLLLYRIVSRWAGPVAAVAAAGFYAVTPLAAALARTQIPDPMLILLLLAAAVTWQSAVYSANLRSLLWTGVWVGLAFQAKMAQAWLVWIAFGLAYLLFASAGWGRRVRDLAMSGMITVVVSAIWVVPVALIPAGSRPWIDGSVNNSVWSMVFGYNGFNRYGVENAGADALGIGGPPGKSEGSPLLYLLRDGVAPQVGWLLPLALIGLGLGLWRSATRASRATYVMWGTWLAVHTVAFAISVKAHTFYNLALVPAIAALAGAGMAMMWADYRRDSWQRWLLPAAIALTVWWGWRTAGHFPAFAPWLPVAIAATGGIACVLLLLGTLRRGRVIAVTAMVCAMAAILVAPLTWTLSVTDNATVSDAHRPAAGPASRETATILSGRLPRLLVAADVDRITSHVKANAGAEKFALAVPWAPQAGQFILRDVRVLPVGGFTAQVPTVTTAQLSQWADTGQLRFALVDGPATKGKPTQDFTGYPAWVRAECMPVNGFDTPLYTLYDCG